MQNYVETLIMLETVGQYFGKFSKKNLANVIIDNYYYRQWIQAVINYCIKKKIDKNVWCHKMLFLRYKS